MGLLTFRGVAGMQDQCDSRPRRGGKPSRCDVPACEAPAAKLAALYGVNATAIHRVRNRQSWRHVQ